FDVLEHVDDPFAVVRRLEEVAAVVCVNLLEPAAGETHLHHELPISALRERAERRGLLAERLLHGRSHLLVWRGDGPATARGPRGGAAPGLVSRLRSRS
ncbi:MAG TPA: hypothetical protein VFO60_03890, partial [Candidatus Dormibacteraeota bacterium]|nr:hypothetical protein [Candidatus Dormibacteraeota bacterium]